MGVFIYDSTWTGFLSTIFEIFERRVRPVNITTVGRYMPDVFAQPLHVTTDEVKAERVLAGIAKKISAPAVRKLYACFLSELPGIENTLYAYIRLVFAMKESPERAYADPDVLRVSQVDKMVHREKHRMEAFVRFQLTSDDLYYAAVEPDYNVLPLILNHFKRRYADQRWLIYDLRRDYGIYYDLKTVEEVTLSFNDKSTGSEPSIPLFHEEEALYQALWKDYFKHVNIKERKNDKLHLQHVPKRYWKNLTEKFNLLMW
ncbi:DNA metabolism protein [Flavihumibacter sp. R14]|nr:DNA metabolism protein [Flavihumibacter soli]